MKHLKALLLIALITLLGTATANAYDFEIDGIYYNISGSTASVTSNGDGSYSGDVVIPSTITYNGAEYPVTSIRYYAFQDCTSLTSVTIPEGVTSIGEYAFIGCTSLTSVTIPESVTSIGDYTFAYSSSLTSVTIPESVTSIGDYTFAYCSSLTSVTIPEGVTSIGNSVFYYCSRLTSVTIPKSVTSIGYRAFYGCLSLTSVSIPESVTSIGNDAFYCCSSLTSVTIPEGVTSIGDSVFSKCSQLQSFYGKFASSDNRCLIVDGKLTAFAPKGLSSYEIPEGVTSIGYSAFYNCYSLTSVTILENVTTIDAYAFSYCSSLTSVTIPEGVTSIGEYAFASCSSLTSVTIPEGVTSIGINAFGYCSSLTSVTIPESVTSIGNDAFYCCSSLTSVTIPEGVTSIGDSVFSECSQLQSFYGKFASSDNRCLIVDGKLTAFAPKGLSSYEIPEGVTSIGMGAFYHCTSLTSVTIPENVTTIDAYAFCGCSSLTSIICRNATEAPRCFYGVFESVPTETCVLTVPASADALYRSSYLWSSFRNIVTYDDRVPEYELTIEDGTLRKGFVGEIPVSLENTGDVVGVQFDVEIPEGVSLCVDEYGDPEVELSGRCDRTFTVTAGMTDGRLRVLVYSNKNHVISGNEGELVTINVTVDEALQPGEEVMFKIVNACVTPAIESGYIYQDVDCPDNEAIFEILRHHTPGDINDDGRFTTADIVYCVEIIMGNTPDDAMAEAADVNEDGKVSISDIAGIVSLILTDDPATSFGKAPKTQSVVETTSLIKATSEEPAAVTLRLDGTTNCVAMQFDITVPEGLEIENVAAENQSAIYEKIAPNRYRAIIYSPTNQELTNNAAIIRFSGRSYEEIQFKNILLTVKDSNGIYELASAPTSISNIQSGVTTMANDKDEAEYYNLQGVKASKTTPTSGIYLRRNGSKTEKVIR